jgi:DNA-binding CsgD family transcriptional regulator/tetratricopeptide (TPR) repeat protein
MVGRSAELAALDTALDAAMQDAGRLIVIDGEAGIGKTRLVETWTATAIQRGARVVTGLCPPLVDDLPYAPILDILRHLSEPESEQPTRDRGRFFRRVADLIVGDGTPTAVVIEDVHWADGSTRDLVAFLVGALRDAAVLLLLTVRDDDVESGDAVAAWLAELARNTRTERVRLRPLTRPEVEQQLAGILNRSPAPDTVDAIYRRGDGNPFFTEELLAAGPEADGLPATVRDVVLARLVRLGRPAHHVLRAAAVVGRSTDHELLAAVAGLAAEPLDAAVREAVEQSLLLPVGDGYAFRHQLVQEIVYDTLLAGERARLHARAAAALEARQAGATSRAAATQAAAVAHHFDAARDVTRTLVASTRAAAAAAESAAPAEAHAQYERVLRLWPQVADAPTVTGLTRRDLLMKAAAAASEKGDNARACDMVSAALGEVDRRTYPVAAAAMLERRGRYAWLGSASKDAWRSYDEAARLVKGQPQSTEQAQVLAAIAQSLMLRSRHDEAIGYAHRAIEAARSLDAVAIVGHASDTLGTSLCHVGRVDDGLRMLREARAIAVDVGDSAEIGRTYHNLVEVLIANGRLEEALEHASEGGQLTRRLGQTGLWAPAIDGSAVHALVRLGRLEEAATAARRALDIAAEPRARHVIELRQAGLEIRRGRLAIAEGILDRLDGAFADDDVQYDAEVARWRAELAIAQRRWAAARAAADCALTFPGVDMEASIGAALCAIATRAVVEEVEDDRRLARRFDRDAAIGEADRLVTRVEEILAQIRSRGGEPSLDRLGYALLARAERSRLDPAPAPTPWAALVTDRDDAHDPYLAAYARWRQAEALLAARAPRSRAAPLVTDAQRLAASVGAAPLAAEIEHFAQRAGINPAAPLQDAEHSGQPETPAARFGLTQRESQVLALLAHGLTNGEIARELFISTKTASVHVSAILRKLGVTSRIQAAAIAQRGAAEERSRQ